jgi:hypothetical protein
MQPFIERLMNDKMDDNGNLSIGYKDGELSINGKKQDAETTKKYEQFLAGEKNFNFSIHISKK